MSLAKKCNQHKEAFETNSQKVDMHGVYKRGEVVILKLYVQHKMYNRKTVVYVYVDEVTLNGVLCACWDE